MSTLVNGTVACDRWIERSGFVVSSTSNSCVMRSADDHQVTKLDKVEVQLVDPRFLESQYIVLCIDPGDAPRFYMPPRRGRSRRSAEGSRAPDSDEDVHRVDDVTRRIVQMEELFDTLEYAPDKRLKLAVLQLRDDAQRWWRGTSRMLRDSGAVITWESFCEAFRHLIT
ncbi:hypothetical protein F511_31357 [Dorcoceras hygrometricum]|uniref:Retrotransposon gag domain-containing protein n=1 Tax=Dorcoceras hygrometricum TaxID=472368 RepID=A0A2Z7AY95_9LAMI|nr:hypothetical protein F511_31357 [Dorcoceras hygrometricum]